MESNKVAGDYQSNNPYLVGQQNKKVPSPLALSDKQKQLIYFY
jgi:hypothetical protein